MPDLPLSWFRIGLAVALVFMGMLVVPGAATAQELALDLGEGGSITATSPWPRI